MPGYIRLENIATLGSQEPRVRQTLDGRVLLSVPPRCFERDSKDFGFLLPYLGPRSVN